MLPIILIVTIIGGILGAGYSFVNGKLSSGLKIGYNYPTASKGLTPNSTKLDVNEILSDEVLEETISEGGFSDLEADDLKETLQVFNIEQKTTLDSKDYYLSTEYGVIYNASKKTQKYDSDLIMATLGDKYHEFFTEKYGRKTNILSDDYQSLAELDYLDVYTYFYSSISDIIRYLDMCHKENSTFSSGNSGETFSSLSQKAQDFRDVSLEKFYSYILKYGLSDNGEQYISKLNYDNRILNISYMKNLSAYSVRLEAIEKYAGDITTAVLVPSRDDDGEFYQSRTKIGTDYFANEANSYLENATGRQWEIEQNNYEIQSLENANSSQENYQEADAMINDLKEQIISIQDLAKETVADFDEQTSNNYMNLSYETYELGPVEILASLIKYALLSFIAISVTVFSGSDYLSRRKGEHL